MCADMYINIAKSEDTVFYGAKEVPNLCIWYQLNK